MRATLVILIVCFASIALADDFKTINGKEYKHVKVKRVEPDGIVLITKSGISKVYFTELPKEVQERFQYDPEKAAQYRATEVEAAKQRLQQQQLQPSIPAATAAPDIQGRPAPQATVSGNVNIQSRNARQKQQKQEEELRSAQAETEAMQAEARGDPFNAEIIRIRADYDRRINAAIDAGNLKLADELRKQFEIKIIDAAARKQLRGR
jgi:hypothetical protein